MSTEKRLLLALALAVLVIFAVEWVFPSAPSKPKATPTAVPPAADPAAKAPAVAPASGAPVPGAPAKDPDEPKAVDPFEFRSGRLVATAHPRGAGIGRLWIDGVPAKPGSDASKAEGALAFLEEPPAGVPGALSVSLDSFTLAHRLLPLEKRVWELVSAPGAVPVVWRTQALREGTVPGEGIRITVKWLPAPERGDLHMRLEVTLENSDPSCAEFMTDLRVRGAGIVHPPDDPTREFLYGYVKLRGIAGLKSIDGPTAWQAIQEREQEPVKGDIEWAATASTYFAAILDPDDEAAGQPTPAAQVLWEGLLPPPAADGTRRAHQPSPLFSIPVRVPAVGKSVTVGLTFFVGPTVGEANFGGERRPVLDRPEYAHFAPVRNPGWFDIIGRGLFFLLAAFHALVPSWGVSIILLTVLVRGLLFPLSKRQMRSTVEYSRKLQKIKPKIDALKEKYGNDRQKISQEQFRLMKEHGVPLMPGGCLLTLLQLPIWIALYGMLQTNFDLRHAPFLWIEDLSQADHLWEWLPGVRSIPMVPNALQWLNLLPLLMTATWFLASKAVMTPPADEQQAQMQKMMQWMPFVMLLFPGFYSMPAGLCLYITASSTWGIVESKIIRKSLGAT